jgi:hypothetical protein
LIAVVIESAIKRRFHLKFRSSMLVMNLSLPLGVSVTIDIRYIYFKPLTRCGIREITVVMQANAEISRLKLKGVGCASTAFVIQELTVTCRKEVCSSSRVFQLNKRNNPFNSESTFAVAVKSIASEPLSSINCMFKLQLLFSFPTFLIKTLQYTNRVIRTKKCVCANVHEYSSSHKSIVNKVSYFHS